MKLAYQLLDVFTTQRLSGNPLAVVLRSDNLLDSQMQAIAREFNLSETVFIRQPQFDRHQAAVRIFTPTTELAFAGHPTIGAAAVLAASSRSTAIRLEEKVGIITCLVEHKGRETQHVRFSLPEIPSVVGELPDTEAIARALGLDPEEIGCGDYRPVAYSAGTVAHLIPVRDTRSLKRIKLERRGWEDTFVFGRGGVYVFTPTPGEGDFDFAARMFVPGLTFIEDPATGSAAGALIGLIAEHVPDGRHSFKLRQGHEMGRASTIELQLERRDGRIAHAGIGGHVISVAEGTLDLSF